LKRNSSRLIQMIVRIIIFKYQIIIPFRIKKLDNGRYRFNNIDLFLLDSLTYTRRNIWGWKHFHFNE